MSQRIYKFSADEIDVNASMLALLGGKGANLAEMASLNIPVPPGFTITTDVCRDFEAMPAEDLPLFMDKLMHEVTGHLVWLNGKLGYQPLLSVRSGAPVSMPGMMDTILNVGLTTETIAFWVDTIGERASLDSYRRLIQMLGSTAYNIDMSKFDFQLALVKKEAGVTADTDLTAGDMQSLVIRYKDLFKANVGEEFPDTISDQLRAAVEAVFRSWMNPRAIEYRKINKIDASMGTAVTIQAMVCGNAGDDSGTGVLFSRDAASGAKTVLGEFLPNAQGEDVVAGIRTPLPLKLMDQGPLDPDDKLAIVWANVYAELMAVTQRLEHHYRDMMDLEFTVQNGKLWLLQCRVGKRSALAAFKIAAQLVEEGLITPDEAVNRVTKAQYRLVRRPRIPESFKTPPHVTGKGASPGVAVGKVVFSSADAVAATEPCVLVTHETCPDDIAGMHKAQGILTATGGATSHAAVVARGMDKPCIVGAMGMVLGTGKLGQPAISVGGELLAYAGEKVTICGTTGRIWFGTDIPVEDASDDPDVRQMCLWAMDASDFGLKLTEPAPADRLLTICLADFWGDDEALSQVFEQIGNSGHPELFVLDATPLLNLVQAGDMPLYACFGPFLPLQSATWAIDALKMALLSIGEKKRLKGLTIAGIPGDGDLAQALKAAGYMVVGSAKTVHDVLFGERVAVSDNFIESVAGSKTAFDALMAWAAKDGYAGGVVRRPVPLEYAAFSIFR